MGADRIVQSSQDVEAEQESFVGRFLRVSLEEGASNLIGAVRTFGMVTPPCRH